MRDINTNTPEGSQPSFIYFCLFALNAGGKLKEEMILQKGFHCLPLPTETKIHTNRIHLSSLCWDAPNNSYYSSQLGAHSSLPEDCHSHRFL